MFIPIDHKKKKISDTFWLNFLFINPEVLLRYEEMIPFQSQISYTFFLTQPNNKFFGLGWFGLYIYLFVC